MRRTAPARRSPSRIHRGSGDVRPGDWVPGFVPGSTRAGRNAKRNVPDGSRSRLTGGRSSGRGPRGRPPPPSRPRAAAHWHSPSPPPRTPGARGPGRERTRKTAATSGRGARQKNRANRRGTGARGGRIEYSYLRKHARHRRARLPVVSAVSPAVILPLDRPCMRPSACARHCMAPPLRSFGDSLSKHIRLT